MLKFNDPQSAKRRAKTKPLTTEQEKKVVEIINKRIGGGYVFKLSKADEQLIQRFLNHYQNLAHFKAVHTRMWAREEKDKGELFEIK